jgi:hypothetical protein
MDDTAGATKFAVSCGIFVTGSPHFPTAWLWTTWANEPTPLPTAEAVDLIAA